MADRRMALYDWYMQKVIAKHDYNVEFAIDELLWFRTKHCNDKLTLRWPPRTKKVTASEILVCERGHDMVSLVDWPNLFFHAVGEEAGKALRRLTRMVRLQRELELYDNVAPFENLDDEKWMRDQRGLVAFDPFPFEIWFAKPELVVMSQMTLSSIIKASRSRK